MWPASLQKHFTFTSKLSDLLNADRASLFVLDGDELVLTVTEDLEDLGHVVVPIGTGIAGTVAMTGVTIRIDDAYSDSRFNQEVDRQTGYLTKSILCLPIKNRDGNVFAVAQLLNRRDEQPFDARDERRFKSFIESLGVILETQLGLGEQFDD